MDEKIIVIKKLTKEYKLYKDKRKRFLGLIFKSIPYKKVVAIDGLSCTIGRGASVAVLGENGAGKSTLLKIITGVVFPTSGSVKVLGSVSSLLEMTAGFDLDFTGRQNIRLKGNLMGFRDKDIKKVEDEIIEFAEVGEYIDQPVRTYSSGMRARLGFSISANVNPDILIVDEALSAGDIRFKKKCLDRIKDIVSDEKTTLLFATHSLKLARDFCNVGIIVEKGKIVFVGYIEDVIKEYTIRYPAKSAK